MLKEFFTQRIKRGLIVRSVNNGCTWNPQRCADERNENILIM